MNWEDLRYFQAIAQAGTLSGAARIVLAARSQEHGKVVITAPPILARHFLAPNLGNMSERHPLVQLSILSESRIVSLSRLDADLALRLSPPIEDTDVAHKIGRMDFGLYAARGYRHAALPDDWEFIAYTDRQADFAHRRWLYQVIGERRVVCEVTDLSNQYEAACSGIGVAGLPCFIGDADARLQKLPAGHQTLSLDVWIALHPDRRDDKLVRNAMRHIAELLAASDLAPGRAPA